MISSRIQAQVGGRLSLLQKYALATNNAAMCNTITACFHDKASNNLVSDNNRKEGKKKTRTFHTLNTKTKYQLCFLRHGQSTWNRDNRFIGWTDTPLTDDGVLEARVAGQMLSRSGVKFDEVHTSLLRRCIRTTNLVLMEMGQEYIPVLKNWRLNERHYGNLVGMNKKEVVKEHGKDQVKRWRRSWNEPPPPMRDDHEFHPALDPRYRDVSCFMCYAHFVSNIDSEFVCRSLCNERSLSNVSSVILFRRYWTKFQNVNLSNAL